MPPFLGLNFSGHSVEDQDMRKMMMRKTKIDKMISLT